MADCPHLNYGSPDVDLHVFWWNHVQPINGFFDRVPRGLVKFDGEVICCTTGEPVAKCPGVCDHGGLCSLRL